MQLYVGDVHAAVDADDAGVDKYRTWPMLDIKKRSK